MQLTHLPSGHSSLAMDAFPFPEEATYLRMLPCLSGGGLKKPVPLDTIQDSSGSHFLKLTKSDHALSLFLGFGPVCNRMVNACAAFERIKTARDDARQVLIDQFTAQDDTADQPGEDHDGEDPLAELGLSELVVRETRDRCGQKRRSGRKNRLLEEQLPESFPVTVDGHHFVVLRGGDRRCATIQVTNSSMDALLAMVKTSAVRASKRSRPDNSDEDLTSSMKNVSWSKTKNAWMVKRPRLSESPVAHAFDATSSQEDSQSSLSSTSPLVDSPCSSLVDSPSPPPAVRHASKHTCTFFYANVAGSPETARVHAESFAQTGEMPFAYLSERVAHARAKLRGKQPIKRRDDMVHEDE